GASCLKFYRDLPIGRYLAPDLFSALFSVLLGVARPPLSFVMPDFMSASLTAAPVVLVEVDGAIAPFLAWSTPGALVVALTSDWPPLFWPCIGAADCASAEPAPSVSAAVIAIA